MLLNACTLRQDLRSTSLIINWRQVLVTYLVWLQVLSAEQEKLWQHLCDCWLFWEKGLLITLQENSDSSSGCLTVLWVYLKDLQDTWDSYIRLRSSVYLSIHRWALQACESKAEAFNSLLSADWWEYWDTQSVHWSTTLFFCESLSGQLVRPSTSNELCTGNSPSWIYRNVTLWTETESGLTPALQLKRTNTDL